MTDAARAQWKFAYDVALRIMAPILLGSVGWTATMLLDHERRVTIIETNSYTQRQASEQSKMIAEVLQSLNVTVAEIRTRQEFIIIKLDHE